MKWFVQKNIVSLGLAAALVILGVTAGILYKNTSEFVHASDWISHKQEIIEELGNMLVSIMGAETAQQGYIRNRGEQQLKMYNAAIQAVNEKVNRLRTLTLDDRKQQQRLNVLEPLVTQKLTVLNGSIQLWKDKPSDAESQASLDSQGRTLMEDIRGIIAGMRMEENELLKQRREDSKTKTQETILILFIGNILSVVLLALVFYRLNREVTEHKWAQEAPLSERVNFVLPGAVALLHGHEPPLVQPVGGEGANGNQRGDEIRKFSGALEHQRSEHAAAVKNIILLGEMGDRLRTCRAPEDAYNVLAHCLGKLFSTASGALCVLTPRQNLMETVAVWGDSEPDRSVFSPDDCWALRRGKLHQVESHRAGLICLHVKQPLAVSFLCVPLFAQDDLLGVLHLVNSDPRELHLSKGADLKASLAVTVANHIALVLSNLRLRENLHSQAATGPHLLSQVS